MQTQVETVPVTRTDTGETVGLHEHATITFEGRDFTSGGAHIDPTGIVGYAKLCKYPDGKEINHVGQVVDILSWDGKTVIAVGRITGRWNTQRSWVSSTMLQVRVSTCADIRARYPDLPVTWTGRTAGNGMICKLRPIASRKSKAGAP